MERSQKYDWFKGSKNQKDKKKDFKKNAKTTWKFTRIFLIFFVLFISLWGCVQGFTLKQSSFVGKGTEFYLNEKEIPPHITEWKGHTSAGTNNANNIYSLQPTAQNIWLNREDDTNDEKNLAAVHTELSKQGLGSMADAYKGVNEANRVAGSSTPILVDANGIPVVGSTASDKIGSLNNVDSIRSGFNVDTTTNATNIKLLSWLDSTSSAVTTDVTFVPRTNHGKNQKEQNQEQSRDAFRWSTFTALNNVHNNWMINALTLQGDYAIPTTVTVADKTLITNIINAQKDAVSVLSYLGYAIDGDGITTSTLKEADWNQMPGLSGETYVPIVTWAQAWERGVGPFYGLAVFPISKFTTAVADAFPFMQGWETLLAMVIVIFVLRFLGFLVSFKSTLQQTKMQELNLKKAAIDAKYAPYKGNKQMQNRQRQEVSEMYKKEGVSPMGAFTSVLIVMPLFLAIWRVIGSTPHIKSTVWYGINFSSTSWRELFAGNVRYLPLMIVAVGLSVGSNLFPKLLTRKRDKLRGDAHLKQAMKKNDKTQIIIMVITAGMSLIFTAGLQVYWIVVSVWAILQAYFTHEILKYRHKRVRRKV